MKIEMRNIEDVHPYENNPRNNGAAVEQVAMSIEQYGWQQPIVVDSEGVIVAGHTRYFAAKKLALAKIPVHIAADLSPEKIKAFRIADNKTHELSSWNDDLLVTELHELIGSDFDLSLTAFTQKELDKLLGRDDDDDDSDDKDKDVEDKFLVLVELKNETEQQAIFDELSQRGLECTLMS